MASTTGGASVTVWDEPGSPDSAMRELLLWQSYAHGEQGFSIPRYLEEHGERLRAKYLGFIHDLGESRIHGTRVVDHLDIGDGFSLWWMSHLAEKSPFKSPRIYDCLRLLALEEVLLDKKTAEVSLVSADGRLAQAIQKLCGNLHIRFVWRPLRGTRNSWSLRRLYRALPSPARGLITLARHLATRWSLRNLQRPQWSSGDAAVFFCSYFIHLDPASCARGQFFSRQWGVLPKMLHDRGWQTNWVHHFLLSSVVADTRTGLSWLRLFNRDASRQGHHRFLSTYLEWSVVVRALRRWWRMNHVSWRLGRVEHMFFPKGSAAWMWPLLRDDWQSSLNGPVAIDNCLFVELFDAVLGTMPRQRRGLYLCENQGWERALLRAWRKHGHGEIVGVQHATAPFWHLYYFDDPRTLTSKDRCAMPLPDRLAVNGPAVMRAFSDAGYPNDRLVEVEALRYLKVPGGTGGSVLKAASASHHVNVLVLGDVAPASMHNLLRLVEAAMKRLGPDFRFTLRPHPGYAVDLARYPALRADESAEALDRILGSYDLAISANSTTAAVEAYQAGLPVVVVLDGRDLSLSPLRGQPDVRFVATPEELTEALQSLRRGGATNPGHVPFFFLDSDLPRWQRLLS